MGIRACMLYACWAVGAHRTPSTASTSETHWIELCQSSATSSSTLPCSRLVFFLTLYPACSLQGLLLQTGWAGLSFVAFLPYHVLLSVTPQKMHGPPGFRGMCAIAPTSRALKHALGKGGSTSEAR